MNDSATPARNAVDITRAAAKILFAIGQPLAAYASQLGGGGRPEAERVRPFEGPVSPAPGAFVIWAPLFVTGLVHAMRSAAPAWRSDAALRRVDWWTTAAYAGNTAWSLQAQRRGLGWVSVALIAASTASASSALIQAVRRRDLPEARRGERAIAPLAGWLTAASFANLEVSLNQTRGRLRGAAERRRAAWLLGAATATASSISLASRGSRLYAASVVWALGSIALQNVRRGRTGLAGAALAGVAATLGATLFGRRWRSVGVREVTASGLGPAAVTAR